MNCEAVHDRVADHLSGDLPAAEALELREHLEGCGACRGELADLSDLWLRLGLVPDEEPSEELRGRFYAALAEAEAAEHRAAARRRGSSDVAGGGGAAWRWLGALLGPRLAVALPSVLLGLALGLAVSRYGGPGGVSEVAEMRREVDSLSRLVTLSLLQQDSASERLKGVSFGRETAPRDGSVVEALIAAATRDPSVNVRLAAIDALAGVPPAPRVGAQLEASLAEQSSPLVQLAVVEYLFQAQPTRQGELARRLLEEESLDAAVKEYLASAAPEI